MMFGWSENQSVLAQASYKLPIDSLLPLTVVASAGKLVSDSLAVAVTVVKLPANTTETRVVRPRHGNATPGGGRMQRRVETDSERLHDASATTQVCRWLRAYIHSLFCIATASQ